MYDTSFLFVLLICQMESGIAWREEEWGRKEEWEDVAGRYIRLCL